jgi:pyruvate dehydrogenase E1 component
MLKTVTTDIAALKSLDERLRWLTAWTIHHANHNRPSPAIMAALYFHALGENDRVAVKPHAGPVLHAIHYLLGSQSREALENFRGFGGAQSYPSRTKDSIPVDFSTGSVGLGVAITLFASLVQDYLSAHGWLEDGARGRFVALIGDAELDEGNIYEAIIEGAKHDVRNLWWIVDYNRQSLDAVSADRMFERFDEIFRSCGWRVIELKYGKRLQATLDSGAGWKRWPMPSCRRFTTRAAPRGARRSKPDWARKLPRSSKTMTTPRSRACSPTLAGIAWRHWSKPSTRRRTTSRPCSSPGRSRASACPSPATRTITRG